MVGIGGGAPSLKHDIRLGDVVVSSPVDKMGGVIHYEFGKTIQNQKFERTGALNAPPTILLTALDAIEARHERKGDRITESVNGDVGAESETTNGAEGSGPVRAGGRDASTSTQAEGDGAG
jgi:hypothetical protein